jgi:hypothetical protein
MPKLFLESRESGAAQMPKDEERQPLPPYIPFRTFQGFIQKLKDTVIPERIDSTLLRSYSGSVGRQITAALKFLEMVDGNNYTTEKLKVAIKVYGTPQWSEDFGQIFIEAYSELIGDLNLEVATYGQLADRFKAWGADGQVLQKCITFYLAATRNIGWTISPHIVSRERPRSERGNRPRPKRAAETKEDDNRDEPASPGSGTVRFSFPIPEKSMASLILPPDLVTDDWEMIDSMVRAYISRRQKK